MEEDSSNQSEDPPLYWIPITVIVLILLFFYPLKTIFGIIILYCTKIGYVEDKRKRKVREIRNRKIACLRNDNKP